MLELEGLRGGWGATEVIPDFSLRIERGQSVSIIGRNGVGKTTLLELIAGRADRHGGRVTIDGADVTARAPHARAAAGLAYVPQSREIFRSLTVLENIRIGMRPGAWSQEAILGLFPSLRARSTNLGAHLSGGEQQMLAIGRALATNPKLLLMDEPTEGLAPVVIDQLVAALKKVVTSGDLTVLIVEQRVDVALELASRCIVMDRGRISGDLASATIMEHPERLAGLIGFGEA